MSTIVSKSGRYLARVRITGYRPASATFNSKKAAQAWAASTEDAIRRGVYQYRQQSATPTLSEALGTYGKTITPRKRGEKKEQYVLKALSHLPLAARPLDQLDSSDFARLRDGWLKDLAPATVQRRLALLSHLYSTARREWGLPIENPLLAVSKPTFNNRRERLIAPDELEAITAQCGDALAGLARLAWYSAARLGELAALKWEYVDLDACTMYFPITKNNTARTVPLVPDAVALLSGRRPEGKASGLVFGMSSTTATKAWARAVVRARKAYERMCQERGEVPDDGYLRDCHYHDLRHSAVTRLAEHGLSTLELSAISGHKSLGMLARYTHISASRMAAKLAALESPRG